MNRSPELMNRSPELIVGGGDDEIDQEMFSSPETENKKRKA